MNGPVAGEQLPPPRARAPRKRDALALLRAETTGWLATGGVRGPHLVPLLFHYDGAVLTFATGASSRTVVNVIQTSRARVAIGHPYDLVMVEGPVRTVEPAAVDPATAESFAAPAAGRPGPAAHARVRLPRADPDPGAGVAVGRRAR